MSFRLGMAFAAVAASRVLRVNAMKHVRPRGGGGGRRAGLVGMDRRRRWHVMEAKSRTYGIPRTLVREAKTQALATAAAPAARGLAIDTRSACVTDLSGDQVYVLIEDGTRPAVSDGTRWDQPITCWSQSHAQPRISAAIQHPAPLAGQRD